MDWLRIFSKRVLATFRNRRLDEELDREVRSHLEMLTEENLRKGMSLEEAPRGLRSLRVGRPDEGKLQGTTRTPQA